MESFHGRVRDQHSRWSKADAVISRAEKLLAN